MDDGHGVNGVRGRGSVTIDGISLVGVQIEIGLGGKTRARFPLSAAETQNLALPRLFPCDDRVTDERLRASMDCNSVAATIALYLENGGT